MAALAIGTETCGSLVAPSNRAALYTIKPTIGLVSTSGIVPASDFCDSAGPMTKSVWDLAVCLDAIVDEKYRGKVPEGGLVMVVEEGKGMGWEGLRVGVLEVEKWGEDEKLVGSDQAFIKQQVGIEMESGVDVLTSCSKKKSKKRTRSLKSSAQRSCKLSWCRPKSSKWRTASTVSLTCGVSHTTQKFSRLAWESTNMMNRG